MIWNGVWTSNRPSREGWYWWRLLSDHPGSLYFFDGINTVWERNGVGSLDSFDEGQWSSEPIPYPTEEGAP